MCPCCLLRLTSPLCKRVVPGSALRSARGDAGYAARWCFHLRSCILRPSRREPPPGHGIPSPLPLLLSQQPEIMLRNAGAGDGGDVGMIIGRRHFHNVAANEIQRPEAAQDHQRLA